MPEYNISCPGDPAPGIYAQNTFHWDVMTCSLANIYCHFGEKECLHLLGRKHYFCSKTKAVEFSEKQMNFWQTTWHHIPGTVFFTLITVRIS
jgi:hypothetical protein